MQKALTSIALVCVLAMAHSALAQPRARRRGHGVRVHPATAPNPPPNRQRICASRAAILSQEQRRIEQSKAQLAGVDAELAQLKRRMGELNRERTNLNQMIATHQTRTKTLQRAYDRECGGEKGCSQYEGFATRLGTRATDVQKQMDGVRSDIGTSRNAIAQLQREIEPVRREYQQLKCNNLVPGETAQTTIDRCSALFSDWNRLQARVNSENNRLATLKSTYEQLLVQLNNIETRAKQLEVHMAKNCATSKQVVTLRGYAGVRQRAESLGKELDSLIQDVSKLRGIQITVTGK